MSDDAQPPRDDAQASGAGGNDPAPRPDSPGAGGAGATWAAPAGGGVEGTADAAPGVGLGKPDRPAGSDGRSDRAGQGADAGPGTDPWAPPAEDAAAAPGGPGDTLASNGPGPWSAPSVHDQQTVTSMPATGVQPPPWVNPGGAAPADGATGPFAAPGTAASPSGAGPFAPGATPSAGDGNPFAAPGVVAPASGTGPFGAPGATPPAGGADPFAPPGVAAPTSGPFAAPLPAPPYPGQDQAVPPPPIAPDGPGQVPYGYPGGYGHPGQGGYAGPQSQGYYGWPGMGPMPSNGMGTAGLVLGIVAAVVFCLWPAAIVLGVLGVVFGALGRGKARSGEATNPGQALAGIICGTVGIVLGIGFGVLVIVT
ncbi:hypothetical protein AB0D84_09165 [Streptomyces sp. NPDC048193]|uniref:hypothetical protein n=1 Tax=unclassified Streptomyces TaxID=2593676 RepID=UPI0034190E15